MSNHIKQMRCYLVGAIESVSDKDAIEWRQTAKKMLQNRNIYVFDPTMKTEFGRLDEIGAEKKYIKSLKENGQWHEHHKKFKQIIHADLKYVDRSDFIIGYIPPNIPIFGSAHEVLVARAQKKKTLIFTGRPKAESNSWMITMVGADYIFETLDQIMEYIDNQTPEELIYNFKD